MQQQLVLSRRVFYVGLSIMLGVSVLSATWWPAGGTGMTLVIAAGAILAFAARLWHRRILRAARQMDDLAALGGYPLHLMRNTRFTSRRDAVV